MRTTPLVSLALTLLVACTVVEKSDEGGTSSTKGGAAGQASSGTGGSRAGSAGTSTTGGAAGASGSSAAGASGSSAAGTSGSSAAGTSGSSAAGTSGSSAAGTSGSSAAGTSGSSAAGAGGSSPTQAIVVGPNGSTAWGALTDLQREDVRSYQSFFLHQSVGADLEDGAQAAGYPFEYLASGETTPKPGLNGGLFNASNGNYAGKTAEFLATATANQATLRVAIMKLGYADVVAESLGAVKESYLTAVAGIKAKQIRVLHVTPPLVYGVPEENAPKMAFRSWMLETFANDVVFDLEDVESTEPTTGARCERGGSWEICDSVRSTAACPSQGQGVDAPTGQGHLCFEPHAARIAKAFLYAIYLAEQ